MSLAVQWLRLYDSTAGGTGSIPVAALLPNTQTAIKPLDVLL